MYARSTYGEEGMNQVRGAIKVLAMSCEAPCYYIQYAVLSCRKHTVMCFGVLCSKGCCVHPLRPELMGGGCSRPVLASCCRGCPAPAPACSAIARAAPAESQVQTRQGPRRPAAPLPLVYRQTPWVRQTAAGAAAVVAAPVAAASVAAALPAGHLLVARSPRPVTAVHTAPEPWL